MHLADVESPGLSRRAERSLDRFEQSIVAEGLGQHAESPCGPYSTEEPIRSMGRDKDDRDVMPLGTQVLFQLHAIHAGQVHIEHKTWAGTCPVTGQKGFSGRVRLYVPAPRLKQQRNAIP